jgi:hypothetical protein
MTDGSPPRTPDSRMAPAARSSEIDATISAAKETAKVRSIRRRGVAPAAGAFFTPRRRALAARVLR